MKFGLDPQEDRLKAGERLPQADWGFDKRDGVITLSHDGVLAEKSLLTIPGNPPNLLRLPKGCPFQPRCPHAMDICASAPPLERFGDGRLRACYKPLEELV